MTTTLGEIQNLAATLNARRPEWDLIPTANYLLDHRHIPYAELSAAATAWASNPSNRTPASLKYLPVKQAESDFSTQKPTATTPEHDRARLQAIVDCQWCDHHGRLPNGYLCPHDDMDERAERAKARAAAARAEIRPMIQTGAGSTPRRAPTCAVCDGPMALIEPGQATHPGCTQESS